ncbi:SDR family NAD(P)-dependent oxidoreductase [Actinomadura verrucosospora]|uniref:Short-chain dehydrogenase/reductase SDR n=1 Tax=Actinomadura verrucosospora TaxID=46165 RepID=A0A7D4A7E6_ACTVE|nr:SDR family oxidoreductase [Actinomadura verrucosospora]QKG22907.1 short-chain dehydrogenase/reductase SDR [Actinomadura verrucosospora]
MALPTPRPDTTALITGASSGIGAALARRLAGRGHGVTLVARRQDRITELARELSERHGVRAEALPCDLLDPAARDELPARVRDLGLRVDVLVNNAGVASGGDFTDQDPDHEIDMVRLNCEALLGLTNAYAPGFEQRPGAILIVASASGFAPIPRQATYAATKAFALSLAEALHFELRPAGTSVTALCPGPVGTEIADGSTTLQNLFAHAPRFAVISADRCAAAAIRGLERNRRVVVPHPAIRTASFFSRNTPHRVLLPATRMFYRV